MKDFLCDILSCNKATVPPVNEKDIEKRVMMSISCPLVESQTQCEKLGNICKYEGGICKPNLLVSQQEFDIEQNKVCNKFSDDCPKFVCQLDGEKCVGRASN